MPGDYPQFPARVDQVDKVIASDTDTMNTALGRARSGRWSILASNGVGDGATDASSALTSMDGSNGGAGVSELAAGVWRVANSISLSHALTVPPGATLKPDSGVTLTISGPIDAGRYKIFDLSAGGLVALGAGIRIYPEWFGANSPGFIDFTPTVPTSGTVTYNQLAGRILLTVAGGTVSGIDIDGKATGLTSGSFIIRPGHSYTLHYSVAPTTFAYWQAE